MSLQEALTQQAMGRNSAPSQSSAKRNSAPSRSSMGRNSAPSQPTTGSAGGMGAGALLPATAVGLVGGTALSRSGNSSGGGNPTSSSSGGSSYPRNINRTPSSRSSQLPSGPSAAPAAVLTAERRNFTGYPSGAATFGSGGMSKSLTISEKDETKFSESESMALQVHQGESNTDSDETGYHDETTEKHNGDEKHNKECWGYGLLIWIIFLFIIILIIVMAVFWFVQPSCVSKKCDDDDDKDELDMFRACMYAFGIAIFITVLLAGLYLCFMCAR
jgi:hypothetical protein